MLPEPRWLRPGKLERPARWLATKPWTGAAANGHASMTLWPQERTQRPPPAKSDKGRPRIVICGRKCCHVDGDWGSWGTCGAPHTLPRGNGIRPKPGRPYIVSKPVRLSRHRGQPIREVYTPPHSPRWLTNTIGLKSYPREPARGKQYHTPFTPQTVGRKYATGSNSIQNWCILVFTTLDRSSAQLRAL